MTTTINLGGQQTQGGLLRREIVANERAMLIFSASMRNRYVRGALVHAGDRWIGGWLPKRFTKYVERSPFNYPKRGVGFLLQKARRMDILKAEVLDKYLQGWDPWKSPHAAPEGIFRRWLQTAQRNGEFGMMSRLNRWTRARKAFRKWAKTLVRNMVMKIANEDLITPLVENDVLRKLALSSATARATATKTNARLRITIPRADRQNWRVNRTITTLPSWERLSIAANFGEGLRESIIDGKPLPGGVPTRRSRQAPARDTSATPRKV